MIRIEGAPIYTFWDECPIAEAMVVQDGRIVAVGSRADLSARYPEARKWVADGARSPLPSTIAICTSCRWG